MTRQIFYLKDCDNPEFASADKPEVICWIYCWRGKCGPQISYSVDLHILIGRYYFEDYSIEGAKKHGIIF
jgi:hypothetical protein